MNSKGRILLLVAGIVFTASLVPAQDSFSKSPPRPDSAVELRKLLEALATVPPVPFDSLPKDRLGRVPAGGFLSMKNPQ